MRVPSLITDNITELLVKIVKFTQARQKILMRNIKNVCRLGFVPKDLAVDEFSSVLSDAVSEHTQSQRLIFYDTEHIKFGTAGSFSAKPTVDEYAEELLKANRDEYLELQINKLLENSLNQRIAADMLIQRQAMISIFE